MKISKNIYNERTKEVTDNDPFPLIVVVKYLIKIMRKIEKLFLKKMRDYFCESIIPFIYWYLWYICMYLKKKRSMYAWEKIFY